MSKPKMRIAVGSDHAGFELKRLVVQWLMESGHDVTDVGPANADRMDYPDSAHAVARLIATDGADRGVLVCGSGVGMAIAANRHAGIRAANCTFESQAELTRKHNDANVLCLGERVVGVGISRAIVDAFLSTDFEGGRHGPRVEKIEITPAK